MNNRQVYHSVSFSECTTKWTLNISVWAPIYIWSLFLMVLVAIPLKLAVTLWYVIRTCACLYNRQWAKTSTRWEALLRYRVFGTMYRWELLCLVILLWEPLFHYWGGGPYALSSAVWRQLPTLCRTSNRLTYAFETLRLIVHQFNVVGLLKCYYIIRIGLSPRTHQCTVWRTLLQLNSKVWGSQQIA